MKCDDDVEGNVAEIAALPPLCYGAKRQKELVQIHFRTRTK